MDKLLNAQVDTKVDVTNADSRIYTFRFESNANFVVFCPIMDSPRYDYMKQRKENEKKSALAGNRTRASRVAGENSTTEPPMPLHM